MKIISYLFIVISAFSVFSSCEKEGNIEGPYSIKITFIEPADSESLTSGEELHMEIDFERSGTIHYIDVLALNVTTGDTIYYSGIVHADEEDYYGFHAHTIVGAATFSECKVIASSWEHDPLEKIEDEVYFTIQP